MVANINVKIELETMDVRRVEEGLCKPYRAHIIGITFEHHAEADSPQDALALAAMHWSRAEAKKAPPN